MAAEDRQAKSATTKTDATRTVKPPKAGAEGLVPNGAYTLQVGIYNTERLALKRAEALKTQGIPAYVARVEDPTPALPGTYYRVRVGSFASSQSARDYGATYLAPAGIDFWADLKGRDSHPVKQVYTPQPTVPKTIPAPAPPAATATPTPKPAPAATPMPPASEPPPAVPTPAPPVEDTTSAPTLPDW
jgi:hypothetical protein